MEISNTEGHKRQGKKYEKIFTIRYGISNKKQTNKKREKIRRNGGTEINTTQKEYKKSHRKRRKEGKRVEQRRMKMRWREEGSEEKRARGEKAILRVSAGECVR